jgi:hypothetical protein
MSKAAKVQATHVDYALHTLGWKAFQDLCVAVAAEVLERPVQVFLPSKDGGRDGAFVGTWAGAANEPQFKSTIQCKFTSKADAALTASSVRSEIGKIARLAKRGLAEDYVLMTNAGVSGEVEAKICEAVRAAGAANCRVLGRDWLTNEIRTRPRLRMMVPRLYGLGDLSQIIDERAYAQARRILSSMGDDLACFVTTRAHRQSVQALNEHGFVLLLGDPASGKSTIGASLAIGALDDGAAGTLKITSPDAFEQHWNPDDPEQFLWIDDAFGPTQYQRGLVDGWNARLKLLRAAVKNGARILMTSRTYVWNAARRDLKTSDFPLFENSQVIIDVQGLSENERAQILYNHVKRGDQRREFRRSLKSYLPDIATNKAFLPETARRLGSRFFTTGLTVDRAGIEAFVERPVDFLLDVLRGLDDAAQAAVALIFLHGSGGVPSPVPESNELEVVLRLTGVTAAAVTRSLEALQGSLVLLVETEDGPKWTFKHPTVADAYAALVGGSPELVELYVRGAKRDRILDEVVCGHVKLRGASVRVPPSLYPTLIERLREGNPFDSRVLRFLSYRTDKPMLAAFAAAAPQVFDRWTTFGSELSWDADVTIFARFQKHDLLPESVRQNASARIAEVTLENADSSFLSDTDVRTLLTDADFDALLKDFEAQVVNKYIQDPLEWGRGVYSTDMPGHFRFLLESLERYRDHKQATSDETLRKAITRLEEHISELEDEDEESSSELASAPVGATTSAIATIFDDIDE